MQNQVSPGSGNIVDVKEFHVLCDPLDGMVLTTYVYLHGVLDTSTSIRTNTWHGKERGLTGNFLTHLTLSDGDPRSLPNVGTHTVLATRIFGAKNTLHHSELVVQMMFMDHFRLRNNSPNASPAKKMKFGANK